MKHFLGWLSLCWLISCYAQDRPFIRGTSKTDRASLTYDNKQFTCKDGSKVIPFERVNDNYCDCPDQSDEPGTSACPDGAFWCQNQNFKGKRIFSSLVGDGVCDCCDGSDEEGVRDCPNTCEQMAQESRKVLEEEYQRYKHGLEVKARMIEEAQKDLESKKQEMEQKRIDLEKAKKEKEEKEEIKKQKEEEEKNARREIEQQREQEENQAEMENQGEEPASNEMEAPEEVEEEEEEIGGSSDEEKLSQIGMEDDDFDLEEELKPWKEETKKAREEVSQADSQIRNLENDIKKIEEILAGSFGEHNEYYSLYGKCFSVDTVEYTYELCPFEKVTQKPKSGGAGTNLGKWTNDAQTDDWKQKYKIMLFSGGQKCWGGPERSTKVELFCDKETRISDPQEPNKCEYSLKLWTPAACQEAHLQALELNLMNLFSEG